MMLLNLLGLVIIFRKHIEMNRITVKTCDIPSLHQDQIFHVSVLTHILFQTALHQLISLSEVIQAVTVECCILRNQLCHYQKVKHENYTDSRVRLRKEKYGIKIQHFEPRPNIFGISSWGIPFPLSCTSATCLESIHSYLVR